MQQILDLLSSEPALWIALVFILSLLVGSFLNVVIHRVPIMLDREWRAQAQEILEQRSDDSGRRRPFCLQPPASASSLLNTISSSPAPPVRSAAL